jgi:hypothetical protein
VHANWLPTLTLWLRCAPLANARTHVIIWADSNNPIYRGELGGSGANGRIWPAMISAELPEGWA